MRYSDITVKTDIQNRVSDEPVFKWFDYPLFAILSMGAIAAIGYFFWFWFSEIDWTRYPISSSVLTLILLVFLANNQGRWFLLPFMKRPRPMAARPGWKVGVATTFVPGSESLDMLEQTLRALVALEYPHDTWVLDEGDDDRVKHLCRRLGVKHFSRKNMPQYQTESGHFQAGWKHGNFNAWLNEIGFEDYEIVSAFDPDHVPDEDFLLNVLGYFDDPDIAYAQVAQAYYNQRASFIARGAAEEVYSYYSSVQMAGYGLGYPVVIGGHTTHRVAALKQMGGFPPHNADDVLITLMYRAEKWRGVYLPKILARGMTPVDWGGYLTQQRRWARSVLDIKFHLFGGISGKLPLQTRVMSFLHGLNYIQKGIIGISLLFLVLRILITGRVPNVLTYNLLPSLAILYGALQACEFYRQRFYLDWPNERGLPWRTALLQYAKWPYLLLAFYDAVSRRQAPFSLTSKAGSSDRKRFLLLPHLAIAVLILIAWIIGVLTGGVDSLALHGLALAGIMAELAIVASGMLTYPEPYDKSLSVDYIFSEKSRK